MGQIKTCESTAMIDLGSLFKRTKSFDKEKDTVADIRNWYSDRYQTITVQRNLLFLVTLLSLLGLLASSFVVQTVVSSKTIEPFVIEVDEKTGITNVVDPMLNKELSADEALMKYFIGKYVTARETYDLASRDYNYGSIVRVLSEPKLYMTFMNNMKSDPKSYLNSYRGTGIDIKFRSIQILERAPNGGKAAVRFSLYEKGQPNPIGHKIANVVFIFSTLEMNDQERLINPIGFQVVEYKADNEVIE